MTKWKWGGIRVSAIWRGVRSGDGIPNESPLFEEFIDQELGESEESEESEDTVDDSDDKPQTLPASAF